MRTIVLLRGCLTAIVLLVPVTSVRSQIVRYATDFPDGTGWTLDPPLQPTWTSWKVDATPASVLGAPAFHSAPNSLNFNDGYCYGLVAGCLGIASGNANSPWIDISAPIGAASLAFWCAFDAEYTSGCGLDRRRVQVSNDGFQTLLADQCYNVQCGPPGVWHQHTQAFQPSWGAIQIRL